MTPPPPSFLLLPHHLVSPSPPPPIHTSFGRYQFSKLHPSSMDTTTVRRKEKGNKRNGLNVHNTKEEGGLPTMPQVKEVKNAVEQVAVNGIKLYSIRIPDS